MKNDVVQLGDVVTIARTAATDVECRSLPFVGLDDIEGDTGEFAESFRRSPEVVLATKYLFETSHVLYGKLRPYLNKVVAPNFRGVCTTEILPLCPKPQTLDREYLQALLLSRRFVSWASSQVSGANLPRLDPSRLLEYRFSLPCYESQVQIGKRIDAIRRMRCQYRVGLSWAEGLLGRVFREMFAVRGSRWPMKTLTELCESADDIRCGPFGTQLSVSELVDAGVPLWGIKHVNSNFRELTDEYLSAEKAEALSNYNLKPGDIVMTRKGTVGNCALYPSHFPPGVMHSDLLRIRPNTSYIDPVFLATTLQNSSEIERQIGLISGGAVMPGVNVGLLKEISVRVPPIDLQLRFRGIAKECADMSSVLAESLRQAEHLFQSMLHEAFGEA